MAIESKISFLRVLEHDLADHLTVTDRTTCLRIVSNVLEHYDVQEIVEPLNAGADDLLGSFMASLNIQGKSQKTMKHYRYVINRFIKFAGAGPRSINVHHIRNWLANEKHRGIADATLENDRQVLSSYFGWLFREKLIDNNPVANIGTIKVPKKKKEVCTKIEFAKLDANCGSVRDRAILHFLASTGCRVSEMYELNGNVVDLERLECVVHGKGNKERKVYMSDIAGMLIGQYLASRKDDNPALFIGRRGERLQPGGVREMLNKVAKKAEVEHIHPHKFRRTLATDLARRGMPIQEVSHLLGHERIDTTMRYVNINEDDARQDYRRCA